MKTAKDSKDYHEFLDIAADRLANILWKNLRGKLTLPEIYGLAVDITDFMKGYAGYYHTLVEKGVIKPEEMYQETDNEFALDLEYEEAKRTWKEDARET